MRWLFALLWLAAMPLATAASGTPPADLAAWLNQVAQAAQRLNYTGTYVYQHSNNIEVSRVAHRADGAGEITRIEALSGSPHVFVHINDEVYYYVPEGDHVKVEKHRQHRFFPALLPVPASAIAERYALKPVGRANVAGRESVGVMLEPRDEYRYGYILWADAATGLLLKAVTLDASNQPAGQFMFTQVDIGNAPEREQLKSGFAGKKAVGVPSREMPIGVEGWKVKQLPAGFTKVMETRRMLPGKKTPVVHQVYTDSLATVSLFIEPYASVENPMRGLASQGLMSIYARPLGEYQVTVLGEVPPVTVMQLANSLVRGN